jgi:dephospho-CoA kinase
VRAAAAPEPGPIAAGLTRVESLLYDIIQLLLRAGPWIVFLVTAAETALFIGLLVPAEATVLVAAFLAETGYFELEDVLLATLAGGLVGDQIGYLLGRFGGRRAAARGGRIGRLWRRHEARATLLFRQRSLLAVTTARFISFVRTLMPWFAGMTGMSYPRFLFYDLLGVIGWGVGSVTIGFLAGRSWHIAAGALGTLSTIVFVLIVAVLFWLGVRARRRMRAVVRVALTGNIASGKSSVTDIWRRAGAVIIDADDLAHEAVEPGTPGLRDVVRRFGRGVLDAEGQLDRAALRRVVFADEKKRRALEAIVHPEVERLRQDAERRAVERGERLVVHSIPLLFEAGLDEQFDIIVLVDAPEAVRQARIVERRGLPEAEAAAMMATQMPAEQKRVRSHYVIENDAGVAELEERAEQVWAEIQARVE